MDAGLEKVFVPEEASGQVETGLAVPGAVSVPAASGPAAASVPEEASAQAGVGLVLSYVPEDLVPAGVVLQEASDLAEVVLALVFDSGEVPVLWAAFVQAVLDFEARTGQSEASGLLEAAPELVSGLEAAFDPGKVGLVVVSDPAEGAVLGETCTLQEEFVLEDGPGLVMVVPGMASDSAKLSLPA